MIKGMGVVYDPAEGLTPKEHFISRNAEGGIAQFQGFEPYDWFKNNRNLVIGKTVLRLTLDSFVDWHYLVTDSYKLEGIKLPAYSGKTGIHDPEAILEEKDVKWELHGLGLTRQEFDNLHNKNIHLHIGDLTLIDEQTADNLFVS